MADIDLTVQKILPTGIVVTHLGSLSISNNYLARNDGRMFLRVVNGSGGPVVCTIVSRNQVGGLAIADQAVTVAAGTEQNIGPFPPSIYNNTDGDIDASFDDITSTTIAALQLG